MLMDSFTLDVSAIGGLTDDEFFRLAASNNELKFERTATGEIIIMALTGGKTGRINTRLTMRLGQWALNTGLGEVFDSSTGFKLPSNAVRSPDGSFVTNERWQALSDAEQTTFAPLCPDFVLELLSASDSLKTTRAKMHEWMQNGCRLAWLLDVASETAYIYRADGTESVLHGFDTILNGEDVLPGFTLDLAELCGG